MEHVCNWSLDVVTEDIDPRLKLHRYYWSIFYEPRALCWILMPETLNGLLKQRLRWAQSGAEVFLKNVGNIWSVRHRRLWPMVLEYCLSSIWAFAIVASIVLWAVGHFVDLPPSSNIETLMPPEFNEMVLAITCLLQFALHIYIEDRKRVVEGKSVTVRLYMGGRRNIKK